MHFRYVHSACTQLTHAAHVLPLISSFFRQNCQRGSIAFAAAQITAATKSYLSSCEDAYLLAAHGLLTKGSHHQLVLDWHIKLVHLFVT